MPSLWGLRVKRMGLRVLIPPLHPVQGPTKEKTGLPLNEGGSRKRHRGQARCETRIPRRPAKQVSSSLSYRLDPEPSHYSGLYSSLLKVSDIVAKKVIFKAEPEIKSKRPKHKDSREYN